MARIPLPIKRIVYATHCGGRRGRTAFALRRVVPESRAAFGAPVSITPYRSGSVPRVYIECLRDRTITIDGQRAMQRAGGCEEVLTIDTDHSPFLSRPRELADHLLSLAH